MEFELATLDISNVNEGYILCKYAGKSDKVVVRAIKSGSDRAYDFYIKVDGTFDQVSFMMGSGTYSVEIYERVTGVDYRTIANIDINVSLSSIFKPFLYPNLIVNFNKDSQIISKSRELTDGLISESAKISAIYNYVVENIIYDTKKADTVQRGYVPNCDAILSSGKGICYDYAVLAAAMLRVSGIPVKVQMGYVTGGKYHAWISVYASEAGTINGNITIKAKSWNRLDPTLAANSKLFSALADKDYYSITFEY